MIPFCALVLGLTPFAESGDEGKALSKDSVAPSLAELERRVCKAAETALPTVVAIRELVLPGLEWLIDRGWCVRRRFSEAWEKVFKVPQRRSLLWGRRFDAPLAGLSLVGLLLDAANNPAQAPRRARRGLLQWSTSGA